MSESPGSGKQNDWNAQIIEEFRANNGRVGGPFDGAPMVLVHHRGRKSGEERVTPMVCRFVPDGYAVFASKAGAPTNPDWYHNLLAHPETTVEFGDDTMAVSVREALGQERDEIWAAQKRDMPGFAAYEEKAAPRQIPVLILTSQS